ncbi:hypothetical protein CEXT_632931 [Caerostris extrusa]|uniref:Uncharacterized protein n=1 Tax=Caerostris extrusa TaxID=172846 RepID=A0AAV4MX72_CAEEX|nr:hypothetical protein CEXT_632931 [Caerostris extrusa]
MSFPLLFCKLSTWLDCMDVWLDLLILIQIILSHTADLLYSWPHGLYYLLFVNLAASSVNVADVKAREVNEELWQNLLFSGITVKTEKAINMLVYKGQSFAFTVWGLFRFTRSMVPLQIHNIRASTGLRTKVQLEEWFTEHKIEFQHIILQFIMMLSERIVGMDC